MKKICVGILSIIGFVFILYAEGFCWSGPGNSPIFGREADTIITYSAGGYSRTTPRYDFNSSETITGGKLNRNIIVNQYLDLNAGFTPLGWMQMPGSDHGQLLEVNDPERGKVQQLYFNNGGDLNKWTGLYWQYPANNWYPRATAGVNLSGADKFIFWARGENGTEVIDACVGGDAGNSSSKWLTGIRLTKEWKRYEIDLRGQDLSNIGWGFGVIILSKSEASANNGEMKIYLDDLSYHFTD